MSPPTKPPKKSKMQKPARCGPEAEERATGGPASRRYLQGKKWGVRRVLYTSGGYLREWDPERGSYMYQHRLVVERSLGRRLGREEVVHHQNGDRTDNRLSNLELLANRVEHAATHHREGTWGWPKGKPRLAQRKPLTPCPVCGREFKSLRRTNSEGVNVDVATCSMSCGQLWRHRRPQ